VFEKPSVFENHTVPQGILQILPALFTFCLPVFRLRSLLVYAVKLHDRTGLPYVCMAVKNIRFSAERLINNRSKINPMSIVTLELKSETYLFQQENQIELNDHLITGVYQNETVQGYLIPDTGSGEPGILPAAFIEIIGNAQENDEGYFGKCIITRVDNYQDVTFDKQADAKAITGEIKPENVNIVHYPDCQQLIFHMPEYAWDAHEICLFDKVRQEEIFRAPVNSKLNGGTMILLDTLPYKPGFYSIKANWPNGWTHELHFIKMIPGFPAPKVYKHPPGNLTAVQSGKSHRMFDSNNVEIIDETEQLHQKIADLLHRRVTYSQDGRGGTITYTDADIRIQFDWEFAGGNGVVIIFVQPPQFWEAGTKTPLSQRQEILEFVAKSVVRDKAPGCLYEISDNFIDILRN
jgi:hypothetical protein